MTLFADGRVAVWLDGTARAGAAYLVEQGRAAPAGAAAARLGAEAAHPAGCACCVTRSAAAAALGTLFQDRARGRETFACVVVLAGLEGCEAARSAVADDPLCQAYFRLG